MVRERGADAYAALTRLISAIGRFEETHLEGSRREAAVLARLWGSREVERLFNEWLEKLPTAYGQSRNQTQIDQVLTADKRLQDRMADEVQGRVNVG
jgi:hypothetical protein